MPNVPGPSPGELLVGVVDDTCRELAGEYRVQKFFGKYRSDVQQNDRSVFPLVGSTNRTLIAIVSLDD